MSARGSFLGSPRVKQDDRNASNCRSICSATFRASEWLKCWMGPWYSWGYRLVSPGHTFERIVQGCKEWQCCGQKYPHTPLIQLSTQRYNSSIRPYSWTISDIFTLKTGLAFKWLACLHVNESQISNVHLWSLVAPWCLEILLLLGWNLILFLFFLQLLHLQFGETNFQENAPHRHIAMSFWNNANIELRVGRASKQRPTTNITELVTSMSELGIPAKDCRRACNFMFRWEMPCSSPRRLTVWAVETLMLA